MNIGIVGWRHFNDYELFKSVVINHIPPNSIIISGGCQGTDLMAERFADEYKLQKIIYIPDPKLGAGRFHARNKQIIDKSDKLIAFVHTESKGTLHSIELAKKKKITIIIVEIK
jgi:hypothetical protein